VARVIAGTGSAREEQGTDPFVLQTEWDNRARFLWLPPGVCGEIPVTFAPVETELLVNTQP
jgi:hypothetical protein